MGVCEGGGAAKLSGRRPIGVASVMGVARSEPKRLRSAGKLFITCASLFPNRSAAGPRPRLIARRACLPPAVPRTFFPRIFNAGRSPRRPATRKARYRPPPAPTSSKHLQRTSPPAANREKTKRAAVIQKRVYLQNVGCASVIFKRGWIISQLSLHLRNIWCTSDKIQGRLAFAEL